MRYVISLAAAAVVFTAQPAMAKQAEPPVELTKCAQSYGTIAVVDGDTQGWTKYGLGSPRDLIAALALESGCFAPFDPAAGVPASYLMNVIAGDKEEVDRGVEVARSAATQGLVRSGALGGLGGRALGGMLGGFGGKKKTLAASIRLLSPASGQTLLTGGGEVQKTTITFNGSEGLFGRGSQTGGYGATKDGQMLAEAFIKAFNAISAQGSVLQALAPAAPAATAATAAKK